MSKYKADNGVLLTQSLFYEWNNPDADFSMRDTGTEKFYTAKSGKKYLSIPHLFRNCNTEYECAVAMLGSWDHWKKLCGLDWFLSGSINGVQYTGLLDWRAEQQLRDEAAAKQVIMDAIKSGDVNAAKFLYEKCKKDGAKAGRPEKKVPTLVKSNVLDIAKAAGIKK